MLTVGSLKYHPIDFCFAKQYLYVNTYFNSFS